MTPVMDLDKNYSFYTIPAAFCMLLIPKMYSLRMGSQYYDIANPRKYLDSVKRNEDIDRVIKNRILRSEGAIANGLETLPLFAAAVLAANIARLPARTINKLSVAYLASRAAYNLIYMRLQDDRRFAPLRTLSWYAGLVCWFTLFVKAGRKVNTS